MKPARTELPRLVTCLQDYNLSKFLADLVAGLTVGLVALPLAMAFAISSGVLPQAGIYTAIIAGFIGSALGGSRYQITGPTGAFVVVVAGIVTKYGLDGLFVCTLMAGVFLMVLGLTGLGTAVKYIPRPVVIGFTNGIAVLIASTQIKDFFGLRVEKVPGDFLGRMSALIRGFPTLSPTATVTAATALLLIVLMMRYAKRIPGAIVALFLGTAIAWGLRLPLETIETRFGGIPAGLPKLVLPTFRPDLALTLLSPAITVTVLGAVESLLSAVVADRMSGDRHNSNTELFAQGVANFFSPLFGGLPATGAIARTATNIRSGAQTPVAGIVHAAVLLVVLLVAAPLAKHIPLCVLAAILFVVAYNMGEWREIPDILKLGRADVAVWLITFALTVFADLSVAVEAGILLAALLYIGRVTATTTVAEVTPEYVHDGIEHSLQSNPLPPGVAAFRIHGPFLFGATDKLSVIEAQIDTLPTVVLLRVRNMTAIDGTGLHALESLADRLHATGRTLVLCGMRDQPEKLMRRAEFDQHLGHANICPSLRAGIERARALLKEEEAVS
ncbi:SulP family inorganic anion transporter [Fimbriimonas ginsengisoli]|uniref:Sulfate transporter n=1 Tax=Fimbriimonas ginsengisoli Gsoil 348 TaxID=661478 RepID=A0A068NNH2_FIMGI|nr:solute carrier family 23 protein [Fimbriimonas ginsengisoli]AIE85006.1 sulfate transporter [Fimbriimonas ginsengisoli Gsoil 348]